MEGCRICPRLCNADRISGKVGFCGETNEIRIARAALHMWEEPCISGEEGSGTIFFTGCNLRCVFCQNYVLSRNLVGRVVSVEELAETMLSLQCQGANNINLVTPTQFVPQIIEAITEAKKRGLSIPIVYNTGGYESVETLQLLDGIVDIYLPDFKYMNNQIGQKYSRVKDYEKVAKESLREMFRQTGKPVFDDRGMLKKGIVVRHLVLPGQVDDSKKVIRYLYETYGNCIYLSIMNQYTPLSTLDKEKYPELDRRITEAEYDEVVDFAVDLGVECAFVQEGDTAEESFIPEFSNK